MTPLLEAAFGDRASWIVDRAGRAATGFGRGGTRSRPRCPSAEIMDKPFQLHCNIDGGGSTVPVVDAVTGQALAWVPKGQNLERMVVAGTGFKAVDRGDVIEMVDATKGGAGKPVRYTSKRAPVGRTALAHLRRGLGLPENALVRDAEGFVHFGGAVAGRLLTLAGVKSGALRSEEDPRKVSTEALQHAVETGWQKLEALCGFGPFQRSLPESVRKEAVLVTIRAHDVPGWLEKLSEPLQVTEEQRRVLDGVE